MTLNLYNSLTNRLEHFAPQDPDTVTFYTCGPTVYDDAHIGNFRSFLAADLLRRWLESPLCTLVNAKNDQSGPRKVVHVMNITDVGHMTEDSTADGAGQDKMELAKQRILESKKSGKLPTDSQIDPTDPIAIARFYEQRFREDARMLGLKVAIEAENDPTLMPRATDNIAGMKTVIADLLERGYAYTAGQPGSRAVYFDVLKFNAYGQLSGNTIDALQSGAGGRVDDSQQQEKHHQSDFLLWKEDPSHTMKWDAPDHPSCQGWDQGYPGWHIECTAMALDRLVDGGLDAAAKKHAAIDLHSGGEDNIFPHHECEIAQSCCFTSNDRFANHWFHPRFLMVEGEKMSKSKGTMHTVRELVAKGIDPAAIRLELIKTHYRANADFSMQGLKDSERMVKRWRESRYEIARRAYALVGTDFRITFRLLHKEIAAYMNDDLNIAGMIGSINSTIRHILDKPFDEQRVENFDNSAIDNYWSTRPVAGNRIAHGHDGNVNLSPDNHLPDLFEFIEPVLGLLSLKHLDAAVTDIALYQPGVTPSDEIESLLTSRRQAKEAKDFAAADSIRDQLSEMGLSIMDKPGGKVEVAPKN